MKNTNYSETDAVVRDFHLEIICQNIDKLPQEVMDYKGRRRELLEPKQVLRYTLKENTQMSLATIGGLTDCDHANILNSIKVVSNLLETDRGFRERYLSAITAIKTKIHKRCLLIGGGDAKQIQSVSNALIKMGKYPVSIYPYQGTYPGYFKKRITTLLDCGSICVISEDSEESRVEIAVARLHGNEIIHAKDIIN